MLKPAISAKKWTARADGVSGEIYLKFEILGHRVLRACTKQKESTDRKIIRLQSQTEKDLFWVSTFAQTVGNVVCIKASYIMTEEVISGIRISLSLINVLLKGRSHSLNHLQPFEVCGTGTSADTCIGYSVLHRIKLRRPNLWESMYLIWSLINCPQEIRTDVCAFTCQSVANTKRAMRI